MVAAGLEAVFCFRNLGFGGSGLPGCMPLGFWWLRVLAPGFIGLQETPPTSACLERAVAGLGLKVGGGGGGFSDFKYCRC